MLVCFPNIETKERVMETLGLTRVEGNEELYTSGRNVVCQCMVASTERGEVFYFSFIQNTIAPTYNGNKILVFMPPGSGVRSARGKMHVVQTVDDISRTLGLVLTSAQRESLRELIGQRRGRARGYSFRILQHPSQLFSGRMRVEDDGRREDEDFLRAQANSLQDARPARRRRLDPEWTAILKEPETAVTGGLYCITCIENRASIVFLPCGHMNMCDVCVKTMYEMENSQKKCPNCRQHVDEILRPIV